MMDNIQSRSVVKDLLNHNWGANVHRLHEQQRMVGGAELQLLVFGISCGGCMGPGHRQVGSLILRWAEGVPYYQQGQIQVLHRRHTCTCISNEELLT